MSTDRIENTVAFLREQPQADAIRDVTIMRHGASRFAVIEYGYTGNLSVYLDTADEVQSLFAYADAEFEAARKKMRRAMIARLAAHKLEHDRQLVRAEQHKAP